MSDRGGRGDRKMGGGPDWLVQKNHDTFGPIGPYIVPKEFMPKPMNVRHYFTLNGEIKQDSNTGRMEYNLWEMLVLRVEHHDAEPRRHAVARAVRPARTSSARTRAG